MACLSLLGKYRLFQRRHSPKIPLRFFARTLASKKKQNVNLLSFGRCLAAVTARSLFSGGALWCIPVLSRMRF